MFDYTIISDGGVQNNRPAACASIIRAHNSRTRVKLVALLGETSPFEAELTGGLLGLSFIRYSNPSEKSLRVCWLSDHQPIVLAAAESGSETLVAADASNQKYPAWWSIFRSLNANVELQTTHVYGHSGHRDNEACDRACRWVISRGERLLLNFGEVPLGREAARSPAQAWQLLDLRQLVILVRSQASTEDVLAFIDKKFGELQVGDSHSPKKRAGC